MEAARTTPGSMTRPLVLAGDVDPSSPREGLGGKSHIDSSLVEEVPLNTFIKGKFTVDIDLAAGGHMWGAWNPSRRRKRELWR